VGQARWDSLSPSTEKLREVQSPQAYAITDFIEPAANNQDLALAVSLSSAASRLCSFGRKFRGAGLGKHTQPGVDGALRDSTGTPASRLHHTKGTIGNLELMLCAPALYLLRSNSLVRAHDAINDMTLAQLRTGIL
jgi:hypothetical protein